MKSDLVSRKQPFGDVRNEVTMPNTMNNGSAADKPLGGLTMRPNDGMDHGPSFGDKNPGAHMQACAHVDNPFFWSGRPARGMK